MRARDHGNGRDRSGRIGSRAGDAGGSSREDGSKKRKNKGTKGVIGRGELKRIPHHWPNRPLVPSPPI